MLSIVLATIFAAAPTETAPASDQDADGAAFVGEGSEGREYIFDTGDSLTGDVLSPDGSLVPARIGVKHSSLIQIRPHFNRELIRLARNI